MVISFGSVNMDMIMYVDCMPVRGESVLSRESIMVCGGKGANQALAARKFGADTKFFCSVGRDSLGDCVSKDLMHNFGDDAHIQVSDKGKTGVASVYVDANGNSSVVVCPGANHHLRAHDVSDDVLKNAKVILMQMEVDPAENLKLVERLDEYQTVVVNLSPLRELPSIDFLKKCGVVIMNEGEAMLFARNLGYIGISIEDSAHFIARHCDVTCIVTLGNNGAIASNSADLFRVGAMPISALDTTGAGDAFAGVIAASLAECIPMQEALRYASVAAGLSCLKPGAQDSIPSRDALERSLHIVSPTSRVFKNHDDVIRRACTA